MCHRARHYPHVTLKVGDSAFLQMGKFSIQLVKSFNLTWHMASNWLGEEQPISYLLQTACSSHHISLPSWSQSAYRSVLG